jgi:hypothetical protein
MNKVAKIGPIRGNEFMVVRCEAYPDFEEAVGKVAQDSKDW